MSKPLSAQLWAVDPIQHAHAPQLGVAIVLLPLLSPTSRALHEPRRRLRRNAPGGCEDGVCGCRRSTRVHALCCMLVSTKQPRGMPRPALTDFGLEPDIDPDFMSPNQTLSTLF